MPISQKDLLRCQTTWFERLSIHASNWFVIEPPSYAPLRRKYAEVEEVYQNQENEICGGIDLGDEYYELLVGSLYKSGAILEQEDPFLAAKWFIYAGLKGNPRGLFHLADLMEEQDVFSMTESLYQWFENLLKVCIIRAPTSNLSELIYLDQVYLPSESI